VDTEDRVIWRRDLMRLLGATHSDTLRKWIKAGKVPKPDVDLSMRTRGWKTSTLRAAGINVV
jgi:predicted DNA-binding transcriptional regulator AlpA